MSENYISSRVNVSKQERLTVGSPSGTIIVLWARLEFLLRSRARFAVKSLSTELLELI